MVWPGRRVLLVDADLRRSTLKSKVANREAVRLGLSHYLSGLANLDESLCVTDEPVMYMLLAGPVPPNPAELLAGRRLDALLDWGRKQFDYILVGTVSDAALLARKCDGAVVVIEAAKIPYRAVQGVVQQLRDANCPVLGAVLSKVENASSRNYKYTKYAYQYPADDKSTKK